MTTSPLPIRAVERVDAPTSTSVQQVSLDALADDPVRRVLLVGSGGGHLAQLVALEAWWGARDRAWVTFDQADSRSLLVGERVYWAHWPTTRNVRNAVKNAWLQPAVIRIDQICRPWGRKKIVPAKYEVKIAMPPQSATAFPFQRSARGWLIQPKR